MKRSILTLLLVFFATLGLSLWLLMPEVFSGSLLSDRSTTEDAPPRERVPLGRGKPEARETATRETESPSGSAEGRAAASGKAQAQPKGRIEGIVTDAYGNAVGSILIGILPNAGRILLGGGSRFEIDELPPGMYAIEAMAEGYVSSQKVSVRVAAHETSPVRIELERGTIAAGRCFDANTSVSVPGALVAFANGVQVRADENGRFSSGIALPRMAFETITVSHKDYDISTYVRLHGQEPTDLMLPLGRGYATLLVRVDPELPADMAPPERGILSLWQRIGGSGKIDLKRQIEIPIGREIPVEHLFDGRWIARVSFPGSPYGEARGEFELPIKGRVSTALKVLPPQTVSGILEMRGRAMAGIHVAIRDETNGVIAETATDASGAFTFPRVAPGRYRLQVRVGLSPADSPYFEVSAAETTTLRFDPIQAIFLP